MIKEGINKQKMTFRERLGHIWWYDYDTLKIRLICNLVTFYLKVQDHVQ